MERKDTRSIEFLRKYTGSNNTLSSILGLDGQLSAKDIELMLRGQYHLQNKPGGNRVGIGGKDMSEEEYLGEGSYRDKAIAEQKRLGREGRGYDLRGGGGQQEDGNFRPTPNVPTITPTYKAPTPTPTPVRDNMANASELDRYREFVEANKEIAKDVKRGQAGYEEIQAILAEKEGGPGAGALLDTMYQYDRSAEDARSLMSGTAEKPMSMEWNTDMPITGRSMTAPIPAEGIPQKGTAMASTALRGGSISPRPTLSTLAPALPEVTQSELTEAFSGASFAGTDQFKGRQTIAGSEFQAPDYSSTLYPTSTQVALAETENTIAFPDAQEFKDLQVGGLLDRIRNRKV